MSDNSSTDLIEVVRQLKQHVETSMDPALLMLVAKVELLVQQQEADIARLARKTFKLKQKLQIGPTPTSRKSKKGPTTSETVDCYVAPSYLSVQSRSAAANGADAKMLDHAQNLADLSIFDAPTKPFEFPMKDCKEADEVSSTTHTESSSSVVDDRATESKRSESSSRNSPTEVLPW